MSHSSDKIHDISIDAEQYLVFDKWTLKVYKCPITRFNLLRSKGLCNTQHICYVQISIRKSTVGGDNYGVFAERSFRKGQIVTFMYTFDKRAKEKVNNAYGLMIGKHFTYADPKKLQLGAHFMNDLQHNCKGPEEVLKMITAQSQRNNQCKFEGASITYKFNSLSKKNQELFVSYNLQL